MNPLSLCARSFQCSPRVGCGGGIARLVAGLAFAVILVALLYRPEPAEAGRPVPGGSYVGECCGGDYYYGYVMVAELRVASHGRTLRGGRRGSYIGCYQDGTLVALRPRRGVPIRQDGTFSFSGRSRAQTSAPGPSRRDFRFRVRGRFRSPDTARIVYSVRPRRGGFGCPNGPRGLRLHHRTGEPPFSGCASQPARTVISSPDGRVFSQRKVFRWAFLPFAYGCLYSADRRVPLGLDGFDESGLGTTLDHFRLAGPYVAYGCIANLIGGCRASVSVVDLRDGALLRGASLPGLVGPADVELKDNGSVAWIAAFEDSREVGAFDAAGQRVLDRGSRIQANSLSLSGSTLTWRKGGQTHSAILD